MSSIYKSPVVSCIQCRQIKSAKGIFSHFITAHTDAGKQRVSETGKLGNIQSSKTVNNKINLLRINYANNPAFCLECAICLPYHKRSKKFCGHQCAATNSNRNRMANGYTISEHHKAILAKSSINRKKKNDSDKKLYSPINWCSLCKRAFYSIKPNRKMCSDECRKTNASIIATHNPKMGGNKNTKAYGWYISPIAGRVWLESSYEYKVATELDLNNIVWERPKYLKYGNKKYFADFYLIDYDVYLDPKNDFLIPLDIPKINKVMEENNVIVIILRKDQLTWDKICLMLGVRLELTKDFSDGLQSHCDCHYANPALNTLL